MRKIWILVVLVLVAIFGGRVWYLNKNKVDETNTVKIGVLLPLTGPTARDGMDALKGMKIALNEVNNSEAKFKIELLIEDNKHSVPPTLSAFNKISDSVPAFVIFGSVPTTGIASLLKTQGKPAISLVNAEDGPIYSTPEIFRAWISINKQATTLSDFVKSDFTNKKIALLRIKAVEGDAFEKVMREQLKESLVITETFSITDIETRNQVAKILDKKPDVIIVYGFAQGYIAALNSLKEQGFLGTIITNQDVEMNHNLIANNADGIYFGMPDYDFSKIVSINPELSDNLFAAFGYESIKILSKVLNENGRNSTQIKQGLATLKDFNTGFGKISYDNNGEIYLPKFIIKQMQADGTAKIIKE